MTEGTPLPSSPVFTTPSCPVIFDYSDISAVSNLSSGTTFMFAVQTAPRGEWSECWLTPIGRENNAEGIGTSVQGLMMAMITTPWTLI